MDSQKMGRRIQEVRKSRGITQSELAQKVDLSTKYISNIECGFKTPTMDTFIAIANALQCDANSLLSDVLDVTTSQDTEQHTCCKNEYICILRNQVIYVLWK